MQSVVHPPHIPFEAKAEPADIDRARHHRPCGRLLGHRSGASGLAEDELVEAAQKADRLEILATTENVGDPLAPTPTVVAVKHRGDGVDPQPVDMKFAQPIECARQQKISNLAAAVVVDQGIPIAMETLPRIGMLVECGAVEAAEPMRIGWKMTRDPVEPQAQSGAMACINKS